MWNDLEMEIGICNKCILEKTRKNAVTGKGNKKADILFIMDSISEEEDSKNDLLVDKKGEYLKKFLEYSKLDMTKCYFTTLTKCSSHGELIGNEQIDRCFDFIIGQIALIKPKYIVTVGENPTKKIIQIAKKINSDNKNEKVGSEKSSQTENSAIHDMVGKIYDYMGIKVIPIYNKSYLFKATDKEKWKLIKIFEKLNEEGKTK